MASHDCGTHPERLPDWSPSTPLALAANALGSMERWQEASETRRRAVDAARSDGERRTVALQLEFLGDDLASSGRFQEALDAYRQAHQSGMTPEPVEQWDSARPLLEAARMMEELERFDDAIRAWQAAVDDGSAGRGHEGDGHAEATLVTACNGLARLLAEHDGNVAALEAMEPGRDRALLIEHLPDAEDWHLRHCADWWTLQSTLLAAIGDRTEADAAAVRTAAIRARIGESDGS
jgi:tetratricopeptide (TPR) repeat protein